MLKNIQKMNNYTFNKFNQACYEKDIIKALEYYDKNNLYDCLKLDFPEFLDGIEVNNNIMIHLYLNEINSYTENTLEYLFNKIKNLKFIEEDIKKLIEKVIIRGKTKQILQAEEILTNNDYINKIKINIVNILIKLYNFIGKGLGHNIYNINDTFIFIDKYIIIDDKDNFELCKTIIFKLIRHNKYSFDYKFFDLDSYIEFKSDKLLKNTFLDNKLTDPILIIPNDLLEYTRFLLYNSDEYIYYCKSDKLIKVINWFKKYDIKLDLKILYYVCINYGNEDIMNFIIENYTKTQIINNISKLLKVFDKYDNELKIYCYSQEQNVIKIFNKLLKYVDYNQKIIHYLRLEIETRINPFPYIYYYLYDLDNDKKIDKYSDISSHFGNIDNFLSSKKNMEQVLKYNVLEKERVEYALFKAIDNEDIEWVKWLMANFNLTRNTIDEYIYNEFEIFAKKYNLFGTNIYLSDFTKYINLNLSQSI